MYPISSEKSIVVVLVGPTSSIPEFLARLGGAPSCTTCVAIVGGQLSIVRIDPLLKLGRESSQVQVVKFYYNNRNDFERKMLPFFHASVCRTPASICLKHFMKRDTRSASPTERLVLVDRTIHVAFPASTYVYTVI